MVKNIILDQKNRIHKDLFLFSIAIFAIIGSIFVFRSYAQNMSSSQKVGSVSVSSLPSRIENTTLVVEIKTGAGLKYCLPKIDDSISFITYIKYADTSTILFEYDSDRGVFCHKARANEVALLYMDSRYSPYSIYINR